MLFRRKLKQYLDTKLLKRPKFKAGEFTYSATAKKEKIDNKVYDVKVLVNLSRLADFLQFIREMIRCRIDISCAYRCYLLNKAVGGSKTSDHPKGNCADISSPYGSPTELGYKIHELCTKYKIEFDQILIEEGCVHVSIKARGYNRNEFAYWIDNNKTFIK